MNIQLSADELLDLLLEKKIKKENMTISSQSSFLLVMSLLESKMTQESDYAECKLQ